MPCFMILSALFAPLIDLFFPLFCVSCKRYGDVLCNTCVTSFTLDAPKMVLNPAPSLHACIIAARYERTPVSAALRALKYEGVTLLVPCLANALRRSLDAFPQSSNIVVPVPLHWRKKALRGFNQSSLIAQSLAKTSSLQVSELLVRTRYTPSQTRMKRAKRLKNMTAAFRCSQKSPRDVLLLDDVTTTFATLEDAARALKAAGARRVTALVVAHSRD